MPFLSYVYSKLINHKRFSAFYFRSSTAVRSAYTATGWRRARARTEPLSSRTRRAPSCTPYTWRTWADDVPPDTQAPAAQHESLQCVYVCVCVCWKWRAHLVRLTHHLDWAHTSVSGPAGDGAPIECLFPSQTTTTPPPTLHEHARIRLPRLG